MGHFKGERWMMYFLLTRGTDRWIPMSFHSISPHYPSTRQEAGQGDDDDDDTIFGISSSEQ